MVKADGGVSIWHDGGTSVKPQNWMTPPTVIEEEPGRIVVRKRGGEDQLDIRVVDVLSDVTHDMGEAAALEKDGVEAHLQELLGEQPEWCGEGLRLVRREWPTDIGPVDLMCRDADEGWVAVEIKRVGTIDAVEQISRFLERILDGRFLDFRRYGGRRRGDGRCSDRRRGLDRFRLMSGQRELSSCPSWVG